MLEKYDMEEFKVNVSTSISKRIIIVGVTW